MIDNNNNIHNNNNNNNNIHNNNNNNKHFKFFYISIESVMITVSFIVVIVVIVGDLEMVLGFGVSGVVLGALTHFEPNPTILNRIDFDFVIKAFDVERSIVLSLHISFVLYSKNKPLNQRAFHKNENESERDVPCSSRFFFLAYVLRMTSGYIFLYS
jgi:hypothetical protein